MSAQPAPPSTVRGPPATGCSPDSLTVLPADAQADHTVRFLSTTVGRDRVHRFLQYFGRFLVWQLTRTHAPKERIARVASLVSVLAQT
ncbi:hypothetical protein BC830DRAFT_1175377, partial [Chytriomyces sp. MP71]